MPQCVLDWLLRPWMIPNAKITLPVDWYNAAVVDGITDTEWWLCYQMTQSQLDNTLPKWLVWWGYGCWHHQILNGGSFVTVSLNNPTPYGTFIPLPDDWYDGAMVDDTTRLNGGCVVAISLNYPTLYGTIITLPVDWYDGAMVDDIIKLTPSDKRLCLDCVLGCVKKAFFFFSFCCSVSICSWLLPSTNTWKHKTNNKWW